MDLIAGYGESDDEDDSDPWSSCRVSTKRTIGVSDEERRPQKKLATSVALPTPNLGDCSVDNIVEDSSSHGNRIRSFPHERGNWASFVHLPIIFREDFLNTAFVQLLKLITKQCKKQNIDVETNEDFHVSLTRTVVLRHHWIEGFVASVKKQIEDVKSFFLYASDLGVYVNEEKTRTFIAINFTDDSDSLRTLVGRMDQILSEYQLPSFYKDPSFHTSIAWCIGDRKFELEAILAGLPTEDLINQLWCSITELICKIGCLQFSCQLN